jgi:hypothetical protein
MALSIQFLEHRLEIMNIRMKELKNFSRETRKLRILLNLLPKGDVDDTYVSKSN